MKLHLPKLLRNSVLACIAAVASITTTTVGTATFTGGVVAFALASQQAMGADVTYTPSSADPVNWTASAIGDTSYASSDNVTLGALQDGTAQLNVTENAAVAGLTINGTYNINVGNGVTLDLSGISFNSAVWSSYINSMTGDGVVKLNSGGEWQFGDMAAATFNLRTNFEVGSGLIILSRGIEHTWNIEETGSLTVNGDLNFSRKQRMNINGGDLAANKILLGHPENGDYDATMKMFSGSITTGMIYTSGTHSSADIFRMEDGTLTFTQDAESAFKAVNRDKLTIELLGGTLKADTSSWKIENVDYTIGNVTVDTGEGKTISLLGNMKSSSTSVISVTGTGTLALSNTFAGSLLAGNDDVTLRIASTANMDPYSLSKGYGDTGASGFADAVAVVRGETNFAEVFVGDATTTTQLKNGILALDSVSTTHFVLKDNVTYDPETMGGINKVTAYDGGVLTVASGDTFSLTSSLTIEGEFVVDGAFNQNNQQIHGDTLVLKNAGTGTLGGGEQILYVRNLVIGSGTTINAGRGDVIKWKDEQERSLTVEEGGVFNLGNHRQTLGQNGTSASYIINLNGGTITGAGDQYGGLDFLNSATINVTKDSIIDTALRNRGGTVHYNIASGATLSQTAATSTDQFGSIRKTGVGELLVTGAVKWNTAAMVEGDLTFGGAGVVHNVLEKIESQNGSQSSYLTVQEGATVNTPLLNNAWGMSIVVDGTLNVTGAEGIKLASNSYDRVRGKGQIDTNKLSISNTSNYAITVDTFNVGSGGVWVQGGSVLTALTTITSSGNVALEGALNVGSFAGLTAVGSVTFTDENNNTGGNGFATGSFYVIKTTEAADAATATTITRGSGSVFQIAGVASDKFEITDANDLIVKAEGTGTYFVKTGPVNASDTIVGKAGFSDFNLADATTLNIAAGDTLSDANAAKALRSVTGTGKVVLSRDVEVIGGGMHGFEGILEVDGAMAKFRNKATLADTVILKNAATLSLDNAGASFNTTLIQMSGGSLLELRNGSWGTTVADIEIDGSANISGNMYGDNPPLRGTIKGNGALSIIRDRDWSNRWRLESLIADGENEGDILALSFKGTNINDNHASGDSTAPAEQYTQVTVTGNNSYSGGTEITTGARVYADSISAFGTGAVELDGGNLTLESDLTVASFNYVSGNLSLAGNTMTVKGAVTAGAWTVGSAGTQSQAGPGGTLEVLGNFTSTGSVQFAAYESSDFALVLRGAENTMHQLDMGNSGNACGRLVLGDNTTTTVTNGVWMRENAHVELGLNASLALNSDITVKGASAGATIRNTTATGSYGVANAGFTFENSSVTTNYSGNTTMGNTLINSSVTHNGAGTLTLSNANNTLSGVHAVGGNVVVSQITSIGTASAARGKTMTLTADTMTVDALTLNGGFVEASGALTLNGLDIDISKYDIHTSHTLVTAGGALTLGDSIDLTTFVSSVEGFNVEVRQTGNTLTLKFVPDVPPTTLLIDSEKTFATADAEGKTTILLADGELTVANDAIPSAITTLEVSAAGGTLQGGESGTVTEVAFDTATIDGAFVIADGGTDITLKINGSLSIGDEGSISLAADQTLDLGSISGAECNDLMADLGKVSGDGTIKHGGGWGKLDNLEVFEIGANVEASQAFEVLRQDGSLDWNVSKSIVITDADKANVSGKDGDLLVGRHVNLHVKDGGSIAADGVIKLANSDYGTGEVGSTMTLYAGGSIKASAITRDKTYASTFTMEGGVLELTSEAGINSGVTTVISGGELVANSASWSITGGRVGSAEITTTGDNTITLTNTTITGTINNDGGKLALSGTVTLDDTDGAFQTQITDTRYSADTETLKGNGFQIVDKLYQVVTDATAAHLDVSGVTTGSWMVGSTEGTYADGYVTVEGVSRDQTYWIGNGELTYSDIESAKNGENKGISIIALYQNGENTGSLVWDKTDSDIDIQAKANTTLTLDGEDVVLDRDQVTVDSGKTLTLTGNGVYDLGETNYSKGAGVALSADSWTGTVKVTNANSSAANVDIIGSLNALGNDKSTVAVAGFKGYFMTTDQIANGLETNLEIVKDTEITINNGNGTTSALPERKALISGDVSGEGDIRITLSNFGSASGTLNYDFAGDVSDWTGSLINTTAKSLTVGLSFTGAATDVGVSIVDNSTQSTTKLTLDADSDMTMNGVVTVDELTVEQNTTFNNSVSATTFTNNAETTLAASHEVEAEGGSTSTVANTFTIGTLTNNSTLVANGALTVTTLNNDGTATVAEGVTLTAPTLANSGTLNVQGTLADGAAVTNSGSLSLAQETATFASLAGIDDAVGTISAVDTALTVTGDATSGAIIAKSLVVNGAINSVGAIKASSVTLNGASNMATGITADSLTLNGATNTLGDLTLGALTLGADVTSLTTGMLGIAGNVVVSKLGADMLTIGGLTSGLDLSISEEELRNALTGSGITSITLGSIQEMNGQTVTLVGLEELNKGQYSYSLDTTGGSLVIKVETNGLTWGGTADDDNKDWSDASNWDEKIAPGGDSQPAVKFLGGGSSEVVIGASSAVKHLTIDIAADTAVEEYTFTAAPGSDWNYLDVENNLSVNKGTLNVGAGVNIYSSGSTEVLEGGALNITQNAFVRALDGINIAGDVTIDAYSSGGTTTNAGKLYVVNDGSINIASTGNVTVNGILSAVAGGTEKDKTADYEYDSLSYNANGSNITNAGTITSSGTIIACGDLTNSGSLTQTGGKLWVFGTLSNTGAASTETPDAGISISGSETVLGALDNAGSLSVSGGSLSTGSMENSGSLSISGGATVTVGGEGATDDTLENSGSITVGNDAEDTGSLVVNGNLDNSGADNNIVVNTGSSLAVSGNLAADGMNLGFAGTVTVGGNATVDELTIKEGASFTANNATIGTLNNDGSLSVGKDVDGTLTGGDLSITTLTGSGDVNVGTDGTLSITNDADFTGKINSEGAIVVSGEATLYTKTDNGGDITTTQLTVTEAANGSTMGTLTTGGIVIESMTTEAPSLNLDSIATNAADGTVAVTLTQMNSTTGVDGIISAVDAAVAADEGGLSYHLLSIANGTGAALELVEDEASHQYLLKKGYNHSDLMSIASFALGAGSTDAYISFWQQSEDEATWDMAGDTTVAGLIVRDASGMLSEDILDNVQKVVMTGEQTIDLSGDDLTRLTLNKLTNKEGETTSKLTLEGDADDIVTINNAAYAGTVVLDTLSAVISGTVDTIEAGEGTGITATVKDTTINVNGSDVLLSGSMENGAINIAEEAGVAAASDLKITGTDLNIAYDDKGATTMDTTGVSESGQMLVDLGNMKGTAGDIVIGKDGKNSALLEKYFTNIRFDDKEGAVVADRNTSYFSDNYTAESANGEAGMTLADAALLKLNPQMDKDSALGAMLTAIENAGSTTARDELAASLAGASSAVLGMAVSGDVDRQLRAIRNRTTTMGVDQSVANEDMPYFNAWINAEGSMNELSDNGTEGGYKLNSWGGTVGFDVDICPTFTAGMAFTAMYGDLDVTGADTATGDLDTYYLSAFARYSESAWTHTFVATVGTGDISMKRTVLGSEQKVETDALSFGLMYEVGRVFALDEDSSACLQPVFNVTWKHTTVDGYTEDGSDLALKVDEQTVDTVTFGLGARLQAVVGESMYNRTSIFEARVLAKADVGDRNGSADVALAGLPGHKAEVESAEMGAFGLEAGAGLTIPVGEEGGSIFMDASVELRSDYTDVNGTVGYRINF